MWLQESYIILQLLGAFVNQLTVARRELGQQGNDAENTCGPQHRGPSHTESHFSPRGLLQSAMHSPGRSNPTTMPAEAASAPRISFSGDFINGQIVISKESSKPPVACSPDFEFLAGDSEISMLPADELFFEGRVLPFWRAQCAEKLSNINITLKQTAQREEEEKPKGGVNWFVDEDPSPRPPKCTVLWKELLKLKKQHSAATEGDKDGAWKRKKGLERTRSASVRIRPVLKMPICTQGRISNILPL